MPILIPGVGAQGGSLEMAVRNGTANFTKPAIINVSRSILYASNGADFAQRARAELQKLNDSIISFKTGKPQKDGMPLPPKTLPGETAPPNTEETDQNQQPNRNDEITEVQNNAPTSQPTENQDGSSGEQPGQG